MEDWRSKLPGDVKSHLEAQIKEVARLKHTYVNEKNAQNIQLWLGLTNLSKGIFDLNLKTKFLEKALKDVSDTGKTISEKLSEVTKIDFQKEINNTFNQISDINSRLKSLTILEKDSSSIKERLIELTDKIKALEKAVSEIEEIKRAKTNILDKFKEIESKVSALEKVLSQNNKKIEKLSKVKVKPIKKKKR